MRVLVVVHAFPPNSTGGAETYADGHARALARRGHQVTVLTREGDASKSEYATRVEHRDGLEVVWVNNTFRQTRSFAESYANPAVDAIAARLIDAFRPDVAHVHHLTCLSTGIVALLHARSVPVVFTLHDYWLLCHRGQLLDTNYRVCNGPEPDGCHDCLGPAAGMSRSAFVAKRVLRAVEHTLPAGQAKWLLRTAEQAAALAVAPSGAEAGAEARARLDHMRSVMQQVTRFLSPSEALRKRFVASGVPAERIQLWPYGHDRTSFGSVNRRASDRLRLGFLGSVMVSKAPDVLLSAFSGLPPGVASADLFGAYTPYHGDDGYRTVMEPLLSMPGVTMHGPIAHEAVPAALASIDVLVVPSIWPENSPLVIREAFLAGVPVVASRIGGIPEAVVDGVNGLLVEPGDVEGMRRALGRLVEDPALLARLREGAAASAVRALEDDAEATERLYESLAKRSTQTHHLAAVVLHFGDPDETRLAVRSLLASRRTIDDLIVVDNDPARRCVVALEDVRDRIVYLESPRNLGYAGGMNLGIREALARGAARVFLVNNDVIVPPDAIGRLEGALTSDPHLAAVGPVVLSRTDPGRVATRGMSYTLGTGRMRHVGYGRKAAEMSRDGSSTVVVDGLSGCALLVSRTAIDAAGFLDENYFFGFEDLDWCLRARRAGLSSAVALDANVYHEGGRAIGSDSPRRFYFAARNHLRLAGSAHSRIGPIGAPVRTLAIVALNLAHACRPGPGSLATRLGAVVKGTRDHFAGRYGPEGLAAPHASSGQMDAESTKA